MTITPSKYRKKPVEIDAMKFATVADGSRIAEWCGGTNESSPHEVQISTLEGTMTATLGDWIIRGVQGEFYPCKPDIFEATYEPVDAGYDQEKVLAAITQARKALNR